MENKNTYKELRSINVSDRIEKKGNLSYLSWAWAADTLLQHDQTATWEYKEPVRFGETLMVFCSVHAFDKTMTAQLPVMDHRNKAIPNPDAFQVNVAMQRALAKAIALHGIGLYIYNGEDLPDTPEISKEEAINLLDSAKSTDELKSAWIKIPASLQKDAEVIAHKDEAKRIFNEAE